MDSKALTIAGLLAGGIILAGPASAQTSDNRVATETAWNIFVEENPRACWGVANASSSTATRNGETVQVNRGAPEETALLASFMPDEGVNGQISFTGGYPFAEDSTVRVEVGDESWELFTENRRVESGDLIGFAWANSPEEDAALVAAFKAGIDAVVTARSSRGTTTVDTFSLLGFTAAFDEAQRRCSD